MTRPVTPTLVLCAVGALIAGLALARPGDSPAVSSAPAQTVYPSDAASPPGTDASAEPSVTAAPADPSVTAAPSEPPQPAAIEIVDFDFSGDLSVAAGQLIVVSNADGAPHTLTASDGGFDTAVIDGGGSAEITAPEAPGTYEFFCEIHPSMNATLTVTP